MTSGTDGPTIKDFLLARIAEDEAGARAAARSVHEYASHFAPEERDAPLGVAWHATDYGMVRGERLDLWDCEGSDTLCMTPKAAAHVARHDPARVLAECAAKRAIIKQHEEWPVLASQRPAFEDVAESAGNITLRMSQNIAWLTEREYVKRFGEEPPTAPMIRALAAVYSAHPDYQQSWAL